MRIHLDLGQDETVDPRKVAVLMMRLGADRDDELLILRACEPTLFPGGRLIELEAGELLAQWRAAKVISELRYHRMCPVI